MPEENDIDFEPRHFLRCHSKKNDSADVQTQVWMCVFEPDPKNKSKSTDIVATCGGNSICFIDVKTGKVVAKYFTKDVREMLYTLSWTTTPDSVNMLASGGARNIVHIINPSENLLVFTYSLSSKKKRAVRIQALMFHPDIYNLLLCGNSDGDVTVCSVSFQSSTNPSTSVDVMSCFSAESEIFSLAFCSTTKMLLAACNDGLRGWYIPDNTIKDTPKLLTFTLPDPPNSETKVVDSIEILDNGIMAVKCALHSVIYICNLANTVKFLNKDPNTKLIVSPSHILHWSNTDNYFMYLGAHQDAGLLCCGDDKGALWLYDISKLNYNHSEVKPVLLSPLAIFPWPEITDKNSEKKRKLNLDVYDIVVDKVTINSSGEYIVAVTNNNLVCIWERCK